MYVCPSVVTIVADYRKIVARVLPIATIDSKMLKSIVETILYQLLVESVLFRFYVFLDFRKGR